MYSNRLSALSFAILWALAPTLAAQDAPPSPAPPSQAAPAQPDPAQAPRAEQPQPQARGGERPPRPEQPAANGDPPVEQPSSEQPAAPAAEPGAAEAAAIAWDDAIDEVAGKRSPDGPEDLRTIQEQVRKVVAYARPATVGVQVGGAVGSAVIVSEDGLALTAGHVAMRPNQRVRFFFADGRTARGVTLGVNTSVDSGMMKITDKGPWPFVPMAAVGSSKPGDWVVGLGQPNGYFEDRAPPVRLGRILYGDDTTLCTDVTLVGGDSGGPLFNLRGQVVGIHSRIGRRIVSNYHVPIDQFHGSWDRLASGQVWGGGLGTSEPVKNRAFLGLAGNSLSGRCHITQVYPRFPADRAGVKVGDIVTSFDGADVQSIDDLTRLVLAQKPGATVTIQVERDGQSIDLQARLSIISVDFPGSPPADSDS